MAMSDRLAVIYRGQLVEVPDANTASLGVLVALRAGQFNLGAEGQIYMGGLGSLLVGLAFPALPMVIHLPLALLGGFGFGAAWGAIAGYLKVARGLNEVLTTLLLNYVAQNLISYLVNGSLKAEDAPSPFSELVADSAYLPTILPKTQAHAGIFVGLAIALLPTFALPSPPGATASTPSAKTQSPLAMQASLSIVLFSASWRSLAVWRA